MREEVERLKDDPDLAPDAVYVYAPRCDLLAEDGDTTALDRLEQVDAAKERRLPRARGADQADDLVLGELEVDPAQHFVPPEPLVDVFERKCPAVFTHAGPPGELLAAVALDQPVREAGERDRHEDEERPRSPCTRV